MNNISVNNSFNAENDILPLLDNFTSQVQHSFEDSQEQIDQDRCYLMEIQQLKRQNKFLKKKIQQLTKKHPLFSKPNQNKKVLAEQSKSNLTQSSQNQKDSQNYIISFIQEVNSLLYSFSQLFSLSFHQITKEQLKKQHAILNGLMENKDKEMQKQLSKLLLMPQQSKLGQLLKIFETYYKQNKERQRQVKSKLELLTNKVIQIGKNMADNVRSRERVKSSKMYLNNDQNHRRNDLASMKSSVIKSTCSELDLNACRTLFAKQKIFDSLF